MRMAWLLAIVLLLVPARHAAADEVWIQPRADDPGRIRLEGEILDYTGQSLTIRTTDGQQRVIAGSQVVQVDAHYIASHAAGETRLAAHDYRAAAASLLPAMTEETRGWVRRLILARLVECYRELGQGEQAGEYFALLVRADPTTPYFDTIPLAWMPQQPSPALEQKAGQWLSSNEPAVQLLGASHLLPTGSRPRAVDALNRLAAHSDHRVALLATTQLWRTQTNVTVEQLAARQQWLDRLPEPLRAGPAFVLASGFASLKQHESAAVWWMQVPILFPHQRQLAAQALWEAGRMLEALDRRNQAHRLYRELVEDYPQSRPAALAQQRLTEAGGS